MATATSGPPGTRDSVPRARWYRVGLLLFLIYLVAYIDRTNISVAAPSMEKGLGLSSATTGVLLSAFFWGYVITQVPGGWAASRINAKIVVIAALVVWGVGAIGTGLVTTYDQLLAVRVLMGLAEGVVWPSFTVMIMNWYPDREQGRAMNIVEIALPLSSVVASPIAGVMIAAWSYHAMFILQGIPAFVLAIVFALIVGVHPSTDRMLSAAERRYLEANQATGAKPRGSFTEVLANPRIWILGVIYFLWVSGLYAFGLWVPSFISQLSQDGIGLVGLLSAIPFVVAAVSMYINARISDRPGFNRAWSVIVPLAIGGVALLIQHWIGDGLWLNMVFLMVAGIGIYAAFGPWWAWAASQVPKNQTGPSMGLINFMGNFGGIVGPIVVGLAAGGGNLSNGFYILGIALLIGAVGTALVGVRGRSPASEPASAIPAQRT
ncbi:MAG: MFS transporter [Nocardiopsaceae bacterium]|nr:MFS transporter [Nocardiopsaceae bacterium]